ncbi:hypothetical protein Dsin_013676 [Dipteronia sinensis]|uniref:Protein FAR1-RELATED SEQUENCE n=1 Tax=Dipteronia sinensis TaxID=43782 RepID=A0AAE0AKK2_9ROSI|nr:hypothetical protein Dsin_013676 [Dipteronia sinensis]
MYNLINAPFVEVNHHWKNVLIGCAFLIDESTQSFVWLFRSFLKTMGNKPPIARTKGLTNARLKSNLEKLKRKVTKGQHKHVLLAVHIILLLLTQHIFIILVCQTL